jgi:hypothetical protein
MPPLPNVQRTHQHLSKPFTVVMSQIFDVCLFPLYTNCGDKSHNNQNGHYGNKRHKPDFLHHSMIAIWTVMHRILVQDTGINFQLNRF